jgi:hypothetical protein
MLAADSGNDRRRALSVYAVARKTLLRQLLASNRVTCCKCRIEKRAEQRQRYEANFYRIFRHALGV